MSRELYIHTLSQFRDECERKHMDTETEAFNTAIQALSAEWDCISRRDVLDWLENGWDGMVLSLFDGIKTLPSAQPEIIRCKDCRWGRKVCGNIECFADTNVPPEYHGYEWFCPNRERSEE